MALWEDQFAEAGWGTAGVLGLGTVFFTPTLASVVGTMVRPVCKGLLWGALVVTDTVRNVVVAEVQEQAQGQATAARPAAAPRQEMPVTLPEARNAAAAMDSALAASPRETPKGKSVAEE